MIRILHVVYKMDRGGTESMIMNLYRHIDRSRVQFDFVEASQGEALFDDEITSLGGRIFRCFQYKPWKHFEYVRWWKDFFKEHARDYVAVHGHLGSTAAIYLSFAKRYGVRTIAHSHSVFTKIRLSTLFYMLYSFPTRFIAEHFFGCSRAAAISRFGTNVGNNSEKCNILNNGIDLDKFAYSEEIRLRKRKELGFKDELIIGHVGRLTYAKNHLFILEVAAELIKQKNDVRILLVGDGELRFSIISRSNELGIQEKVILAGDRSDVNELLQAMDVFVFPSIFEGLPLSLIEAQAAGLSVFASTNVPSESDVTGLCRFMELGNPQAWAEAILATDISRRRSYVDECRKAGYDIQDTTKWLQDYYLSLSK